MKNNDILENGLEMTIIEQNAQIEDLKFHLSVQRTINICSGIVIIVMSIFLFHYFVTNKILEDKVSNLELSNKSLNDNLVTPKY